MSDEESDFHFYRSNLCHNRYSLICLAVKVSEVASYVHRLLRQRRFNTQAKRMGTVIGVSPTGLSVWREHAARVEVVPWDA
jgi:hypothetical protein